MMGFPPSPCHKYMNNQNKLHKISSLVLSDPYYKWMNNKNRSPECSNNVKLSVKSPSLSPPIPSFEWYPQSKEILLNLN
jgi:hypothetical protein